ncbi:hypothetical protein SKAU_G00245190 [Synaphobranchus kaupii]|uniref:Uncharacterized protein n=1 Tax=Synaphobranchus kaupii TaxID=118154 RepID=A0A9Q1F1R5_SYNKA|nr:hypothetical protein SKAU_G00245190 [Synaphobranchus kaupii]
MAFRIPQTLGAPLCGRRSPGGVGGAFGNPGNRSRPTGRSGSRTKWRRLLEPGRKFTLEKPEQANWTGGSSFGIVGSYDSFDASR